MTEGKERALIGRFPNLYDDHGGLHAFQLYGFELNDGWFDILFEFSERLEQILTDPSNALIPTWKQAWVHQIKEKLGGLRIYLSPQVYALPGVDKAIERAEERAYRTCDLCGKPGEHGTSGFTLMVRCKPCRPPNRSWVTS